MITLPFIQEKSVNKQPMHKGEVNKIYKEIILIGVAALIASIVTMNIPSANASTTYADGSRAGKAEGHSNAINGRPANDRSGSGHSNEYCLGYKVAYNAEYYWTRLVQDPR